ncbi:MAG: TonB family protein [Steroidobacteraceae bacterium]
MDSQSPLALRRSPAAMLGVAAAHGLLIIALMNVLDVRDGLHAPEPMQWTVIAEPPAPTETPPPSAPSTDWTPTFERLPPPEPLQLAQDDMPPPLDQDGSISPGGDAMGPTAIAPTSVRADPRFPLTQPPYPSQEVRMGHEGAVNVAVLVGVEGRVLEARVSRSSGYAALDEAALREARRNWRFLAATADGNAIAAWHEVRVVFRLDR